MFRGAQPRERFRSSFLASLEIFLSNSLRHPKGRDGSVQLLRPNGTDGTRGGVAQRCRCGTALSPGHWGHSAVPAPPARPGLAPSAALPALNMAAAPASKMAAAAPRQRRKAARRALHGRGRPGHLYGSGRCPGPAAGGCPWLPTASCGPWARAATGRWAWRGTARTASRYRAAGLRGTGTAWGQWPGLGCDPHRVRLWMVALTHPGHQKGRGIVWGCRCDCGPVLWGCDRHQVLGCGCSQPSCGSVLSLSL